jgi:hypothetical protein
MRGRVCILRAHDDRNRRHHRHQPRHVYCGQVRRLRRFGTAVLRILLPQLRHRPFLPQQHLFDLW